MRFNVKTKKRRRTVAQIVWDAVRSMVAGVGRYGGHMRRRFYAQYAETSFSFINAAFLVKSSGGTDDLGLSWPPPKPGTIAARPIDESDIRQFKLHRRITRGILSPTENAIWIEIFKSRLAFWVSQGLNEKTQAKPRAAAAAWAILKAQGARTRKDVLSQRRVAILADRRRLERSLRPGNVTRNGYSPYNRDQLWSVLGGQLHYGTRVPYAIFHKRGTKHMPARPPIPSAGAMHKWNVEAARDATIAVTQRMVKDL